MADDHHRSAVGRPFLCQHRVEDGGAAAGRRTRARRRRKSTRAATAAAAAALCFACIYSPAASFCIDGVAKLPPSGRLDGASSSQFCSGGTRMRQAVLLRVASTTSDATVVSTKSQLQKMTVKDLKSYMEERGISVPRGQSSSLKLKKDIVDFIWAQQAGEGMEEAGNNDNVDTAVANGDESFAINGHINGAINGHAAKADAAPPAAKKARVNGRSSLGTGMPPLPNTDQGADEDEDAGPGEESTEKYVLTPKDRIVLDVLNRYPPLHESIINACALNGNDGGVNGLSNLPIEGITTANIEQCDLSAINYVVPSGLGEKDIRHDYHPMVANAKESDMDVVFVGTASCTPGVTRGVSCTALRLNWRSSRTYDQQGGQAQQQQKNQVGQKKRSSGAASGSSAYFEERGPTGGTWLFDCGESTQLSIQKTSSVKPGKISKIFITHCHGDHSFGLPGLLCLMGTDRDRDAPPVEIYGPEGLRMWLRVAVRYSVSRVVPPYRVHELMDVPMAPEWEEGHRRNGRFYFQLKRDYERRRNGSSGDRWGMQGLAGADPVSWISRAPMINLEPSRDFGEVDGGRDIYPRYDHPQSSDGAPVWDVEDEEDVTVHAAPMSHGVPCVGYVVTERDRPGRLRPEAVLPVIERNRQGLIDSGVANPMKVMAMVKNLPVGGSYAFPDGTVVRQEDVVEPPRKGRKVVICGDTADCRALEVLGKDADVLVHEATNSFLKGIDKDGNMGLVTRDAKIHGHSTPPMAGDFAKRINAKKLVLNHFSARYKGDQSVESITIMTRMERQAMKASGLPENSVAAAWDFMVLPVSRNE